MVGDATNHSRKGSGLGPSRMGDEGLTRFLRRQALIHRTGDPLPLSAFAERECMTGNRAALAAAMPAMLRHEGWWRGTYRDVDCATGALLDEREVTTRCAFPDAGPWHYVQHNRLRWADGREATYEFGGRLDAERIVWETDRFAGYGWQTAEDTLMLRLERRDVADAFYIEAIHIAPDDASRARTWHWFRDGRPWKRTLCDEVRVEGP